MEISQLTLPKKKTNIFGLLEPNTCVCSIKSYRLGMTQLELEIGQESYQNKYYIAFSNPIYFEGPTTWQGANFYLSSDEECLQLILDKTHFLNNTSDAQQQDFIHNFLLFKTRNENKISSYIAIVAHSAVLIKKDSNC